MRITKRVILVGVGVGEDLELLGEVEVYRVQMRYPLEIYIKD